MSQNFTSVTIGGKSYRLATSQDKGEEYIQQLAAYIDKKLSLLTEEAGAAIIYKESFPVLFALNIAEDLFAERDKNTDSETSKREADLNAQINALNVKLEFYRTQDNKNKDRWDDLIKQLQNSAAENKELTEKLEKNEALLQAVADESNKQITSLTSEKEVLEQQLSDKIIALDNLTKKTSEKNQELNKLSLKLAEKNTLLNELNVKSADRNQKLNAVNKERDELAIKLKESKNHAATLERQLETLEAKMQLGSKGYSSLQKEKTELDREITDLKNENTRLKDACDALTKENAKLSSDYKKLNTKSRK